MTSNLLVLDASAAVMLLVDPGTDGEAVASRLSGAALHAPAYFPVEVTSVLRRMRNSGKLSTAESTLALRDLWTFPIELWPQEVLSDRTWELGQNFTAYDASYVALAEHLGAPLLTGDARLARASGARCEIELVANA